MIDRSMKSILSVLLMGCLKKLASDKAKRTAATTRAETMKRGSRYSGDSGLVLGNFKLGKRVISRASARSIGLSIVTSVT
jgi:hypothetical protein